MQNFNISRTAAVNLTMKRGDTLYFNFQVQLNGSAVALDNYTYAKMQVRSDINTSPVLTLVSTGASPTIDISNLAAGQIIFSASTADIAANTYYYDCQLWNDDNTIETVIAGNLYIVDDFTQ